MGFSMELVKARRRIKELETKVTEQQADIADLLEQLALGTEKPSMADIVPQANIIPENNLNRLLIKTYPLNIPFTKPPLLLPIMEIPNTGSMDGIMDYGNNNLYAQPADEANHKIMVDWIAQKWFDSKGLDTVDMVYRIMANEADNPGDFTKIAKWYAIHRLVEVGTDTQGRFFWFAGVNNPARDPYPAHDKNLLWINLGVIN